MELATFEKIQYLVCGQRIFADRGDYLAIGGLHRGTDSYAMLPQQVDGLHDVVCKFCEVARGELSAPTSLRKRRTQSRGKNGLLTGFAQLLHPMTWPCETGRVAVTARKKNLRMTGGEPWKDKGRVGRITSRGLERFHGRVRV